MIEVSIAGLPTRFRTIKAANDALLAEGNARGARWRLKEGIEQKCPRCNGWSTDGALCRRCSRRMKG